MKKLFSIKHLLFMLILGMSHFAIAQRDNLEPQDLDSILLQSVFDTTNIKKRVVEIDRNDLRNKRHVRLITVNSYNAIRGKLVSYNKYGLFVYESNLKRLGFYPFKNLRKIKMGRSYGHFNVILSSVGGIIGGIVLASDKPILFPVGVIIGAGATAYYSQIIVGPLYAIYKWRNKLNWNLRNKKTNSTEFYRYYKAHPEAIRNIEEFGVTQTQNTEKVDNATVTKSNNSHDEANIETTSSSTQTGGDIKPATVKEEVKVVEKRKFLEGQSFGDDNNVKAKWIFTDFNSSKLYESEIQSVFKNIRGMQLSRGQLSKYNTTQLQFLAMMICSGGGYNMKNVLTLTDKQRKFLGNYESGYLEDVNIDGTISTMNLSDIDLENLKVIFAELGDR